MFCRFLLCLALVSLSACAAMPLAATRDAAVAPVGKPVHTLGLSVPQLYTDSRFSPTVFGGSTLDYAYRTGVSAGTDRAIRVGLNLYPITNGMYVGFEQGRDVRRGTRAWGTVAYTGAVGGVDGIWGALLPGHIYVQGYGGLVAGKIRGRWRPEIGLRGGVQAGQYGYRPYGAAIVSAEPRLRVAFSTWSLAFGLGLDAGGVLCKDCVFGPEPTAKPLWGVRPLVSVQAP